MPELRALCLEGKIAVVIGQLRELVANRRDAVVRSGGGGAGGGGPSVASALSAIASAAIAVIAAVAPLAVAIPLGVAEVEDRKSVV